MFARANGKGIARGQRAVARCKNENLSSGLIPFGTDKMQLIGM
jgi:hypothetical protein